MRAVNRQRVAVPLVGGTSDDPIDLSAQESVNVYPAQSDAGVVLRSVPGEVVSVSLSATGRGMYTSSSGDLYAVAGSTLYRNGVAQSGTVVGSGRVRWTDNANNQVGIVAGGTLLVFDGVSVTPVSDTDLISGIIGTAFIDQYTLVCNTTQIQFSTLNDMTTWGASDVFTAEGLPDPLVDIQNLNRRLYIAGSRSMERYYNDQSTPFSRDPSGHVSRGCANGSSVVKLNNQLFWIADNHMVYAGNDPTNTRKISTDAIDIYLRSASVSAAFGYGYEDAGHSFVSWTFPDRTITYDGATSVWHTRETFGDDYLRTVDVARDGANLKALKENGDIVTLGVGHQASGSTLRRRRTIPHIRFQGRRFRCHQLELIVETGGATGVNMELQYSHDRGRTWSDPEDASVGDIGEYAQRVRWHSIEASRDLTFRFTQTDNAPATWVEAYGDFEVFAT